MERRGVLLLGRPLNLPQTQTAATVRVRDGETLVTDGPFTEAKEWIAGFNLVECSDLDDGPFVKTGEIHRQHRRRQLR